MGNTLLIATGNAHKAREIADIFVASGLIGWRLLDLNAYAGYSAPPEDGLSFAANAAIKARAAAMMSGLPALADDSGLAVDALQGAPGLYSARYAGPEQDEAKNRAQLLAALHGLPRESRGAAFICAAALAFPAAGKAEPALIFAEGRCEGLIAEREAGAHGFGYDSLFYLPAYDKTMAELDAATKNRISHRYWAMRRIAEILKSTAAV